MSLKVKLVRSMSGHTENHRETLRGLGLTRVGRERVLQDTPAVRGMIDKVQYLIEWSETNEEFKPFGRRSRQKAQKAASAKEKIEKAGGTAELIPSKHAKAEAAAG
jgi:large subunit ribosomal protein L30